MESKGLAVRLLDRRNRDYYGGTLMMAIGLSTAYVGSGYGVGTFSRMGPGFFPTVLGALLALVGLGIAVNGRATSNAELVSDGVEPGRLPDVSPRVQARGWVCIVASVIAFVVLGKYGGLLPASFGVGFIAALGDPDNRLRDAVLLSLALCVVATVVFWWALRMQFPLLTWG